MIELSIIVPTHARPRELERCLNSIKQCQLNSYEIIVVSDINDPSTHELATQYLRDEDIYVVRNGKNGPAESRNLGIKLANGRHVLMIDDDDALPDNNYKDFVQFAIDNPGYVVYGDIQILKEDREKQILFPDPAERIWSTKFLFESMYVKNFIYSPACIYPIEVIRDLKMDVYMRSFEDWEFLLLAASKAEFKSIDMVVATVYKDYVNTGNRRSTTQAAKSFELVLDYLYVYRRWPAPTQELKKQRHDMLASVGLDIDAMYL